MTVSKRIIALIVCAAMLILLFPVADKTVTAAEDLVLNANEAEYINLFDVTDTGVTNPVIDYINSEGVTTNTFKTNKTDALSMIPYVSFTVESERLPNTPVKISVSGEKSGYIAVVVDNKTVKTVQYNGGTGTTNLSVNIGLAKGVHTVTVTSLIPKSKGKAEKCSIGTVTFTDNVVKAQTQVSPIDNLARLEAETYGVYNRYYSKLFDATASGSYLIGGADTVTNQEYSTLENGFDALNTAAVTYTVTAPEDGKYTVKPIYSLKEVVSGSEQYFAILVNDKKAYKVAFSKAKGLGLYNGKEVEIDLKKGENTIRCIPYTDVSKPDSAYTSHAQDCLALSPELKGIKPTYREATAYERLESDEYGHINKYDKSKEADENYSAGYRSTAAYTAIMQSFEDLRKYGVHFENDPYIGYTVLAPEDGVYSFKVGYSVSEIKEGQYMALVVNGATAVKSYFEKDTSVTAYNANKAYVNVTLRKGRNTIYTVPYTDIDGATHSQDYLDIDSRLSGVALVSKTELKAQEAQYVNLFTKGTDKLQNSISESFTENGIYKDNFSISSLPLSPYFSYTVDAPEDGYYSFAVEAYVDKTAVNADGSVYYGVVVDNTVLTEQQKSVKADDWSNRADISATVYLSKGSHTITVTSVLPATLGAPKCWTDYKKLVLFGGLTKSAKQVAPKGTFSRFEAETFGTVNLYDDPNQVNTIYSNGHCVGYCNSGKIQAFDTLENGLQKDNTPYVLYKVVAPKDGKYQIKIGYYLDKHYPEDTNQFFAVLVNGKAYKSYFSSIGTSKFNNSVLEIELKEGKNEVYCIPYVNVNDTWHNQDYLEIESGLDMAEPTRYQRLEAEVHSEYVGFTSREKGVNYYSGDWALSQASYNFTEMFTEEQMKKGPDPKNPQVGYTIMAPEKGEYYVRVGYVMGSSNTIPAGFKKYVYIYVNGKAHRVDSPSDEIAIELNKGKNEIVCGIFSKDTYLALNKSTWINYDYLDISDTVTCVMPEKLAPESDEYTRFEAEKYAMTTGYYNSNDNTNSGNANIKVRAHKGAQTLNDIKKNGLSSGKTPYAQYDVTADKKGEYKIRLGFTYLHEGEEFPNGGRFNILVFVNGEMKTYTYTVENNRTKFLTITEKVKLNKGKNIIRVTAATGDSVSADQYSYVMVNQDYIDLEKGLTVPTTSRVEAEDSINYNYYPQDREGLSNDRASCGALQLKVYENKMSFDRLTANNSRIIPSVRFSVIAEKAGTYTISFGISSGRDKEVKGDAYVGLVVNSEKPQKLYYPEAAPSSCIAEVTLREGKNAIAVTSALLDGIVFTDEYNGIYKTRWIDYDYLSLPEGVIAEPIYPIGDGDDLANLNDPLILSIGTAAVGGTGSPATGDSTTAPIYAFAFIAALAVLLLINPTLAKGIKSDKRL